MIEGTGAGVTLASDVVLTVREVEVGVADVSTMKGREETNPCDTDTDTGRKETNPCDTDTGRTEEVVGTEADVEIATDVEIPASTISVLTAVAGAATLSSTLGVLVVAGEAAEVTIVGVSVTVTKAVDTTVTVATPSSPFEGEGVSEGRVELLGNDTLGVSDGTAALLAKDALSVPEAVVLSIETPIAEEKGSVAEELVTDGRITVDEAVAEERGSSEEGTTAEESGSSEEEATTEDVAVVNAGFACLR